MERVEQAKREEALLVAALGGDISEEAADFIPGGASQPSDAPGAL